MEPDSPKRNYKKRCDKSGLLDWTQITLIISQQEGRRLSRQAILGTHKRMLKKLKNALASDPYIKDWMIEHGLETRT
jgi:hypothetical protein